MIVLSDTKGQGFADSVQTFVQNPEWTSPLGIAVIDNVVYVSHAPTITKYVDVNRDGKFELSHMDEFIDSLLREERACDVILPRIQVTEATVLIEIRMWAFTHEKDTRHKFHFVLL